MSDQPPQLNYAAPQTDANMAHAYREVRIRRRGIVLWSLGAVVHFLFWSLIAGVILFMIVGPLNYLFGSIVGFPAWIVLVVMFPVLAFTMRRVRRRRAATVLAYVQQALRLNQPLNRVLYAASRSEKGRISLLLDRLRMSLETAVPLSAALHRAVPETPPRTLGLIHFAERGGRLPETVDYLVREELDASRNNRANCAFARWYLPIMLLISASVIAIITTFVLPRFGQSFRDFRTPLPAVTQWISHNVITIDDWPILLLIQLILLFMCGIQLAAIFTARRRNNFLSRPISDRFYWIMPIIHRQQLDRAMADICRSVGDFLSLDRTLDSALLEASQLEINFVMQDRVRKWADGIGKGLSLEIAAERAKMPAFLSGILATAKSSSDLSKAFAFLGRYYASRFDRRAAILQGMIVPAVTFVMGAIVCLFALSIFQPLTRLVEILSTK